MGVGVLFGTVLALFILILSPISYFLFKKFNLKKLGIVVSIFLASIVIVPSLGMIFESQLYFKSDARNDLIVINISLKDDFEIIDNVVHSSGNDIYQFTELKISDNDRNRIVLEIKKSRNFKIATIENTLAEEMRRVGSKKIISNYSFKNSYIRESYEKKKGYVPIRVTIRMLENSNILKLKRIS